MRDGNAENLDRTRLVESEARTRAILDAAVDAILTIDERGTVETMNPAGERLFGYPREEVIGRNVKMLMPPPYQEEHDDYLTNYLQTGTRKIIGSGREVVGRRKDGSTFPMHLAVSELTLGNRRMFTGIARDISDIRNAIRDLKDSEARTRAILDAAVDAILTIDENGIVGSMNRSAERLFGFAKEDIIGQNVKVLMPAPYQEEHDEYLSNYLTTGRKKIIGIGREVIGRRNDGTTFPMDLAVSETVLGGRRIFTGIVRDITERKRAEESLNRQAEELARSNVELERFAYVASHDLQEPMRTVRSFAQLLQRRCGESLNGEGEEFLRFITEGVQRMQTLINDLLAYSRVNSQGGAFAPADCKEILDKVLDNLQASIETRQAQVQVASTMPTVTGDATQLGQVFQNLLANALKFHGNRPPQIRVSARETPGEWTFTVSDNGIGIAQAYFERIFIIFQRLHTIEEYGGTGIGLAICKKIVERHGGKIWLDSTVGEGSSFHFSIPRRERLA